MAGTRTAPAFVSATPTERQIALHLIDASGDLFTQNITVAITASDAEIQAYATAYAAGSNASLWQITDYHIFTGDADPANAVAAYRGTVAEGINMLWRDSATLKTITPRLIAPVDTTMDGNKDVPLPNSPLITAITVALALLLNTYTVNVMQFTGRRERKNNPRVKT